MADDFQYQHKVLEEMGEQIQNYEIAGKKEAANRLNEQLTLLGVSLSHVSKFLTSFPLMIITRFFFPTEKI